MMTYLRTGLLFAVIFAAYTCDTARAAFIFVNNPNATFQAIYHGPAGSWQVDGAFQESAYPLPMPVANLRTLFNHALTAQGSAWTVTGTFNPQGTMTLTRFDTYAGIQPSVTMSNPNGFTTQNYPEWGPGAGVAIGLNYAKTAAEPADLHWLQLVYTNVPGNYGAGPVVGWHAMGDPYPFYIDNGGNASPFYDHTYSANSVHFADIPYRGFANDTDWRAYLVLARDIGGNRIEISDQDFVAYYGFHDPFIPNRVLATPAPPTILCLLVLLPGMVVYLRRLHVS